MKLGSYVFHKVSEIIPTKNEDGTVYGYNPKDRYKKKATTVLNAYGGLTFCDFVVPKHSNKSGVYALFENDSTKPLYIGRAVNFDSRWSRTNYAHISPKNCYVGGQSTNCHVNSFIYEKTASNVILTLYFYETPDYKKVEAELIRLYKPFLNTQLKKE